MVHGDGIMGARAAHLNGLGCHINYLERDKKMEKDSQKKKKKKLWTALKTHVRSYPRIVSI